MLDRCGGYGGLVEERGGVDDGTIATMLRGARALLFPSFAEGYGLPLVEALALGVPAICSDIPALVEVGGGVPEHLHPLDGAAWRRAILDYASDHSAARAAQLGRLRNWVRPDWSRHFSIANALLARLAAEPRGLPVRIRGVRHGTEDFPWSAAPQSGTP
jgi:glycosyltransferase involved in cell wall biosynthesis